MNAANIVVEVGRTERNIVRAREAWKVFKGAEDMKRAEHKLNETRQALEAALRCVNKLDPKDIGEVS